MMTKIMSLKWIEHLYSNISFNICSLVKTYKCIRHETMCSTRNPRLSKLMLEVSCGFCEFYRPKIA